MNVPEIYSQGKQFKGQKRKVLWKKKYFSSTCHKMQDNDKLLKQLFSKKEEKYEKWIRREENCWKTLVSQFLFVIQFPSKKRYFYYYFFST